MAAVCHCYWDIPFFLKDLFINFWLCSVFIAECRLSLVAANGGYSSLQCLGFSLRWILLWSMGSRAIVNSCGTWASLLCSRWDLPRLGIEPLSAALTGEFLTTKPSEEPGTALSFLQAQFYVYIFSGI